jgi:hypothetical protein
VLCGCLGASAPDLERSQMRVRSKLDRFAWRSISSEGTCDLSSTRTHRRKLSRGLRCAERVEHRLLLLEIGRVDHPIPRFDPLLRSRRRAATRRHSNLCDGIGTYQWSVEGDMLTLTLTGADPCSGRTDVLAGQTFVRSL